MKVKVEEHIQKHIRFYKAALMALVPLVVCAVTCVVQGYAIWDAYIPASEWNDELFYYKQVENIIWLQDVVNRRKDYYILQNN